MARPANWEWETPKVSGGIFNITALEWTNFQTRINEFRIYAVLENYAFTAYSAGMPYSSAAFNEARTAISQMGPAVPSEPKINDPIYASDLNLLRDALNSIV